MAVYSEGLQRYINRDDLSLKTSGAETASTTHASNELGDKSTLYLAVEVTAASESTPTMLVTIEGSNDGITWFTLGRIGLNGYSPGSIGTAPTDITTTGTHRAIIPAARYVRSKSTIAGGTPSFTYSVGGNSA